MTNNKELVGILNAIAAGKTNSVGDHWSTSYCAEAANRIEELEAELQLRKDEMWVKLKENNPTKDRLAKVKKIISTFQKYVANYDGQMGYTDYTDETIINDIVYGLGTAFDNRKYTHLSGFVNFKKIVIRHLQHED